MVHGYVIAKCRFFTYNRSGEHVNNSVVIGVSKTQALNTVEQREYALQNAIQHGASKYLYNINRKSDSEYGYLLLESGIKTVREVKGKRTYGKKKIGLSDQQKRKVHKQVLTDQKENVKKIKSKDKERVVSERDYQRIQAYKQREERLNQRKVKRNEVKQKQKVNSKAKKK